MELVTTVVAFIGSPAGAATLTGIGVFGETLAGIGAARAESSFARTEAKSIRLAAAADAENKRRQTARLISKNQNIRAASGLDTSSGTSLAQFLDEAKEAKLDELTIRHRGEVRSQSRLAKASLARATIPGIAFGGLRRGGSILSELLKP